MTILVGTLTIIAAGAVTTWLVFWSLKTFSLADFENNPAWIWSVVSVLAAIATTVYSFAIVSEEDALKFFRIFFGAVLPWTSILFLLCARGAQANRMFHLCENWCLFNALNPELESWYWDPWKSCWRETYSADGVHRGYCDRVIRNPDSIELKFVNERSSNILSCNATRTPTEAPVDDGNTTYFLGEEFESCDEACARNNLTCAADQTARRFLNEAELLEAFLEAEHTCDVERVTMNNTRYEGWALPGLRGGSFCTNRQQTLLHLEDLDSDCNRVIGENWQRLCACY